MGVLLLVHGVAEHSGRYGNLVEHFVPQGFAVCGFDHMGHGRSEGRRAHVVRFEDYVETLRIYFGMVREGYPDLPIYLVGHSMGGLISAFYLLDYQKGLTAAVLSAPAVKIPDEVSSFTVFMGKLLSALIPKFGLIRIESDGISRDPDVVRAYEKDPLVCRGKISARLAAEVLRAVQRVTNEAARIDLPVLLLQGTADRIVDPAGAQMLFDSISSEKKEIKHYEGLYHEVFNEPERAKVFGDMENWVK